MGLNVASGKAALAKDAGVTFREGEGETLIVVGARVAESAVRAKEKPEVTCRTGRCHRRGRRHAFPRDEALAAGPGAELLRSADLPTGGTMSIMRLIKSWTGRYHRLLLVSLVLASGCAPQQRPPSPAGLTLAIGSGSLAYYRWKEGPAVMICFDIQGGHGSAGEAVAGPPWVVKQQGFASSVDGRRVDWQLETTDGRSVKCHLDGQEYDLAKGPLFLVKTKGGKTEVEQLSRDLSAVQPDFESCKGFVRKDPAVSRFLGTGAD
jgi:hypothetical protein